MVQQLANYFHTSGKPPSVLNGVGQKIRVDVAREWGRLLGGDREAQLNVYHAAGLTEEMSAMAQSALRGLQNYTPKSAETPFEELDREYRFARRAAELASDNEALKRIGGIVLEFVEASAPRPDYWFDEASQILSDPAALFGTAIGMAEKMVRSKPEESLGLYQRALKIAESGQLSSDFWERLGTHAVDLKTAGVDVGYPTLEIVHSRVQDGPVGAVLKYFLDEAVAEREAYLGQHFGEALKNLGFHEISSATLKIKDLKRFLGKGGAPFALTDYAILKDGRFVIVHFTGDGNVREGLEIYSVAKGHVETALNSKKPLHASPQYSGSEAFNYIMGELRSRSLFW